MTIEIARGDATTVYRVNPTNPCQIDWRENRHKARWQYFCTCASPQEATTVLLAIQREAHP